jgi:hypothetical protein
MSKQAGEIVALVAAAAATGIAVAMAIEATPGRGKFGRSSHALPEDNPRERRPSRADMIDARGLEPEGRSRQQKYAATTAEFWKKVKYGSSEMDVEARRKLGIKKG